MSSLTICGLAGVDLDDFVCKSVAGGEAIAWVHRAPGKETANEDGLLLAADDPLRGAVAVADGIGGQVAGERASRCAVEALGRTLTEAVAEDRELRGGILDGFEAADRGIAELRIGAGTTLCAVSIERGDDGLARLRTFHVGDSAALLCGQRGVVKHLTVMHSPVGYAIESGMLDADEAIHHDERHLISNAVGAGGMKIEIGPTLQMAARDTLVVATDGLWDNLRTEEIVELVRSGPLRRAAGRLRDLVVARMAASDPEQPSKPDDLGFVLFRAVPARRPAPK